LLNAVLFVCLFVRPSVTHVSHAYMVQDIEEISCRTIRYASCFL